MAFSPEEIGQIIEQFIETVGTRQYIGARYVPIFGRRGEQSIEWDNSAPYEPLTIVLYQGNSYTSRQYVPAGVDITNADFWAATGTYNAQIAAYVAQVQQFDGRITANSEAIADIEDAIAEISTDEVRMYMPPIDGSAILVTDGTTNILFDAGKDGQQGGQALNTYLRAELQITRLDVVVLTHMHPDHVGGLPDIIGLCNSNTVFFTQMAPTNVNGEFNQYTTAYNATASLLATNNLQPLETPQNGSTRSYGAMQLQFFNTDPSYKATYDTTRANNGYNAQSYSGINNYSLITFVTRGGFTYCDTGDVEGEAQRLNLANMRKVDVARNPHHFANRMGYMAWYQALAPETWIVTLTNNQVYAMGANDVAYQVSYLYRYVQYANGTNRVYYAYNRDVRLRYSGAHLRSIEGNVMQPENPHMLISDGSANQPYGYSLESCLPPYYYNTDPYCLRSMSLADLVKILGAGKNEAWIFRKDASYWIGSQILADAQAELAKGFGTSLPTLMGLEKHGAIVTLIGYSATQRLSYVDLFTQTYVGPSSNAGKKTYTIDPEPVNIDFSSSPLTTGTTYPAELPNMTREETSALFDRLLRAPVITVTVQDGNSSPAIPCVRTGGGSIVGGTTTYRGMSMSSDGTTLYYIALNVGNVTAARKITVSSGAVSSVNITRMRSTN